MVNSNLLNLSRQFNVVVFDQSITSNKFNKKYLNVVTAQEHQKFLDLRSRMLKARDYNNFEEIISCRIEKANLHAIILERMNDNDLIRLIISSSGINIEEIEKDLPNEYKNIPMINICKRACGIYGDKEIVGEEIFPARSYQPVF